MRTEAEVDRLLAQERESSNNTILKIAGSVAALRQERDELRAKIRAVESLLARVNDRPQNARAIVPAYLLQILEDPGIEDIAQELRALRSSRSQKKRGFMRV